mmetsp:Transcript_7122/g.13148  ORF Transcript_7122/g.13148 Transcript_7122/m.13148 type:complete len:337 (+) Transcript_7122:613-1623(+)
MGVWVPLLLLHAKPLDLFVEVVDGSTATYEVRMVGVDVRQLNRDEVGDHLLGGLDLRLQELVDTVQQLVAKLRKPAELWHQMLALGCHLLQLVEHHVHTLQARALQPVYLLLDEQFEGHLRHEQRGPGACCVADRRTDVPVREAVEWLYVQESLGEDLVEHIRDPGSTVQLPKGHVGRPAAQSVDVVGAELGDELEEQGTVVGDRTCQRDSVRVEQFLCLSNHGPYLGFELRQHLLDVAEQKAVEPRCQVLCAAPVLDLVVLWMRVEEGFLRLVRFLDFLPLVDVRLRAVDDGNEPEPERDDLPFEHVHRVCPSVHQVQFCQDAKGAVAVWIHLFC